MKHMLVAVVSVTVLTTGAARASSPDVARCLSVASDTDRLQCYDAAAGYKPVTTAENAVQKWNGSGTKNTEPFTMSGPWRLSWNTSGMTDFTVMDTATGMPVSSANTGEAGGKGSSFIPQRGKFYIEILAFGDWKAWASPMRQK